MLQSTLTSRASGAAISKYLIPDLPSAEELLPYLRRIDAARWYSNFGPLVCEFEERLVSLLSESDTLAEADSICLCTLVSGHHAVEIGLWLAGMGPGKRVLVPAVTFAACPLAVQHTGAEAVLGDVDPLHWMLTPKTARAAAEHSQIDAVMPVAVYGVPVSAADWDEFTLETGIPVVIDAAAALQTQQIPRHCLVAHSLHATKPFGIGEGGVLACRDPDKIKRSKSYANFGMIDRVSHLNGANAKMSEFHAAVGLAQLRRWADIKARRLELLNLYIRHLKSYREMAALHPRIETAVVSCLMLLLKEPVADSVLAKGSQAGVGFHRTYLPPLYRHPHFKNLTAVDIFGRSVPQHFSLADKADRMTNSEQLRAQLVGVPFHPFMDEADVVDVVTHLSAMARSVSVGPTMHCSV